MTRWTAYYLAVLVWGALNTALERGVRVMLGELLLGGLIARMATDLLKSRPTAYSLPGRVGALRFSLAALAVILGLQALPPGELRSRLGDVAFFAAYLGWIMLCGPEWPKKWKKAAEQLKARLPRLARPVMGGL